jgi:hypothetical protein
MNAFVYANAPVVDLPQIVVDVHTMWCNEIRSSLPQTRISGCT